jgi:hypothetical protein
MWVHLCDSFFAQPNNINTYLHKCSFKLYSYIIQLLVSKPTLCGTGEAEMRVEEVILFLFVPLFVGAWGSVAVKALR